MKRKYLIIGWMMAVLAGCQNQDDMADTKPYVQADLAMALTATVPATRMATDVVQEGSTRRNIQDLRIVPFSKTGEITSGDRPRYYEASEPTAYNNKESGNKRFYYCQSFFFMPGVASFLVYGRAETVKKSDNTVNKAANGSLLLEVDGQTVATLPKVVVPASLTFKPEPMLNSTTAPAEAECIAKYLTAIANVYGQVGTNTVRWSDTSNSWLKAVYLNFINQGNAGTSVLAGSARNVKAYVNKLYQEIKKQTFEDGTMEKAIATAVMDMITNTSAEYISGSVTMKVTVDTDTKEVTSLGTCDSYPNNYDLPDGAAVLLWMKNTETSYAFVPQVETTTTAKINAISRFAYPAELYYYGNSLIKTNNEEVTDNTYYTETTWDFVLSKYQYDNSVVTTSTKAVAIKEPLQYGVAHLNATVKATTTGGLPDANGATVTVGTTAFPITGIIIDKQRPVGFDFKPLSNNESDVRFVYDSHIDTNSEHTPYCLAEGTAGGPFHTLVLQNNEDEDVTVILELQNDSGQDFKGENGVIYKGTKFYLVGKVVKPTYSEGDDDYKRRVFTQDHTTTIGMEISSLAHAYNVLPDILGGRLEIGVEIKTDWEAATPTTVIFE